MTTRTSAILVLTTDQGAAVTIEALGKVVSDTEAWLSLRSPSPPVVVVLQVEGLTSELCTSGALGMNAIPQWKPAQDVVDAVKLPESHVLVSSGDDTQFTRVLHPFCGNPRDRRADRVVQRDAVQEFVYDGETVKHNLIMTLEFAIHYSDYDILYVFGHGRMHTLNRLVRDLKQTAKVPVGLSPYLLLPAMQNFISMNSRILILTWCKATFEDNYDAILPPPMNVQRKRIKIVGIDDVLRAAGLEFQKEDAVNCDSAIAAVVAACKEIVYRYEKSDLQIRAILCPDHTVLYQDALMSGLQGSSVLVYSLRNMVQLSISGMQTRDYSWELSEHMQSSSAPLFEIADATPERTPVMSRSHLTRSCRSFASPRVSSAIRQRSRFGTMTSDLCMELHNELQHVSSFESLIVRSDSEISVLKTKSLETRRSASFQSLAPDEKTMGILQVDGAGYWNKLPIRGDAADANTFGYQVHHMRPEGFSFQCCQAGPSRTDGGSDWHFVEGRIFVPDGSSPEAHLFKQCSNTLGKPRVADRTMHDAKGTTYIYTGSTIKCNFIQAVDQLVGQGVIGIGSDCGFMISMNDLVREIPSVVETGIPVALSSLALLPILKQTVSDDARILVLTANSESFDDFYDKLVPAHMEVARSNLIIVGCQGVEGFGAEVAEARTVNAESAAANIVQLVQSVIDDYELRGRQIRSVLFECAELPGYTDMLQSKLRSKVPIYDAISLIDFLRSGMALSR